MCILFTVLAYPAASVGQITELPGRWYDIDKPNNGVYTNDRLGGMSNNYWYDTNGNGSWDLGEPWNDNLGADLNGNYREDGGENWSGWVADHDMSCWAAASANLVYYAGGGNRYDRWVYDGIYANGATGPEYLWPSGGPMARPLEADYIPHTGHGSNNDSEWSFDAPQWISDRLADGLPVGIGVTWPTDEIGDPFPEGVAHWVTIYAIDTINETITLADNSREFGNQDFSTFDYDWVNDRFTFPNFRPNYAGERAYINRLDTLDTTNWQGHGAGGGGHDWHDDGNWSQGVPGSTDLPRVEMSSVGQVWVRPGNHAEAMKLIIRGTDTSVVVEDGGQLTLGAAYVDEGQLLVHGRTDVRRVDVQDGWLTLSGGELHVDTLGEPTYGDLLITGSGTFWMTGASTCHVEGNYGNRANATVQYSSRLTVDGGFSAGGSFLVNNNGSITANAGMDLGATNAVAAEIRDSIMNVGSDLRFAHGTMSLSNSSVLLDSGDMRVGGDDGAGLGYQADVDIQGSTLRVKRLYLADSVGSRCNMVMDTGGSRDPWVQLGGLSSAVHVGHRGEATIVQNAGELGRESDDTIHPSMVLGTSSGAVGEYTLNGGRIEMRYMSVGQGGEGTFIQNDGRLTVHERLTLASLGGGRGTFDYRGGQLFVEEFSAGGGVAEFNQDADGMHLVGEIHEFDNWNLASLATTDFAYDLIAKTITADTIRAGYGGRVDLGLYASTVEVTDRLYAGYGNRGHIEQNGGTVQAGRVVVSSAPGADHSHYILNSGSLTAGTITVARQGIGSFTQHAGSQLEADILEVGGESDSMFNHYHQDGGEARIADRLDIGVAAGSRGTYQLSQSDPDADAVLTAAEVAVGYMGRGTFEQLGGTHNITTVLTIAMETGSQGDYWHNGGNLNTQETRVGAAAAGEYDHRSGTHTTDHLVLGTESGGDGTYSMAVSPSGKPAPLLNATQITVGAAAGATGTFTMATGQVHATGNIFIGDATGATGSLTVDRPGAEFHVDGDVHVGGDGEGTLTARASGVFSVDGTMTVGGDEPGTVIMEGGRIEGAGTMDIGLIWGTLRGRGWVYLPVHNEGLIIAEGSGLRFWEPVTSSGGVIVQGSASMDFMQGGVLDGSLLCSTGSIRVEDGVLELNCGLTGSAQISINGELNIGSSITARNISVGQWGLGPAVISHPGPHSVIIDESYVGTVGRYDLQAGAILSGGDGFVGGLFNHQDGEAAFGELMIGGGDDYAWEPGHVAEYRMASGELEMAELLLGVPGPYNMMNPMPGRFTVLSADADVTVSGGVTLGPVGELDLAPGVTIHMTGSFWENSCEDPQALADLINLELIFEGGTYVVDSFEVAGVDLGLTMDGFVDNFALGILCLSGTDVGNIQLVNESINCGGLDEALYVEHLTIGDGSRLDLNGHKLYYLTADIAPGADVVLNGGHLQQVPEPASLVLLVSGLLVLLCRARLASSARP